MHRHWRAPLSGLAIAGMSQPRCACILRRRACHETQHARRRPHCQVQVDADDARTGAGSSSRNGCGTSCAGVRGARGHTHARTRSGPGAPPTIQLPHRPSTVTLLDRPHGWQRARSGGNMAIMHARRNCGLCAGGRLFRAYMLPSARARRRGGGVFPGARARWCVLGGWMDGWCRSAGWTPALSAARAALCCMY
ncbi:hypothetical protein FA95DRAFT_618502 [Auriscalpium vulgare]|uniref:Uncharacterized protein n=1 Tax=Auriscalpium vulgare TaxID=40419 RepID=A0ACB8S1D5_9AGAM|nr:hypothetical protein FA95DRAFT_618502 [Auriscalpium vulgare]